MLKHRMFSDKKLFLEKRLLFLMGGEAPKAPEAKEGPKATPEQPETDLIDKGKRNEVYAKVEQKILELRASDNPHAKKRAERLQKMLDGAKQDEAKGDVPMAITSAFQLRDHLASIAHGEEIAAAKAKKKEKSNFDSDMAALDAAGVTAEKQAAALAAIPVTPKMAMPDTPLHEEVAKPKEPTNADTAKKAEPAPAAPPKVAAAPASKPAAKPAMADEKAKKRPLSNAELAALAQIERATRHEAATLAKMPAAGKPKTKPAPTLAEEKSDKPKKAEAPNKPEAPAAPPKVAKSAPDKPAAAPVAPIAGLSGLAALSPSAGPKGSESSEADKPKRTEVIDVKRLPDAVRVQYEAYAKGKDSAPKVVDHAPTHTRYTFERYVSQSMGVTFSKVKIYREENKAA